MKCWTCHRLCFAALLPKQSFIIKTVHTAMPSTQRQRSVAAIIIDSSIQQVWHHPLRPLDGSSPREWIRQVFEWNFCLPRNLDKILTRGHDALESSSSWSGKVSLEILFFLHLCVQLQNAQELQVRFVCVLHLTHAKSPTVIMSRTQSICPNAVSGIFKSETDEDEQTTWGH